MICSHARSLSLLLAIFLLMGATIAPATAEQPQPDPTVELELSEDIAQSPLTMKVGGVASLPLPLEGFFFGLTDEGAVVAGGMVRDAQTGQPIYHDRIFISRLPDKEEAPWVWVELEQRLPEPLAFGAAVVDGKRLILLGGKNQAGPSARVTVLAFESVEAETTTPTGRAGRKANGSGQEKAPPSWKVTVQEDLTALPDLPGPRAHHGAVLMMDRLARNRRIFIVGGAVPASEQITGSVLGRDLVPSPEVWFLERPRSYEGGVVGSIQRGVVRLPDEETFEAQWQPLELLTPDRSPVRPLGDGLIHPVLAVQNDELAGAPAIFVMGGLAPTDDPEQFTASGQVWKFAAAIGSRRGWEPAGLLPEPMLPLAATAIGPAHILVMGHLEPEGTLHTVPRDDAQERGATARIYHTFTRKWVSLLDMPDLVGNALIRQSDDKIIWLGHGTPAGQDEPVLQATLLKIDFASRRLAWVDFLVIALYSGILIAIGTYFAKREKHTGDYFVGGRRIPWWAAGISIYATGISAISFMAIPAKTFATDWSYICLGLFPPITTFIAAYLFVPILRRLPIMTMMEYMEMRFDRSIRTASSVLMILSQIIARMGVTLLLPSIALSAVTGWDVVSCILVMGVISTIYTVMGGIGAVIWTDVIQCTVIFGAAILSFFLIAGNLQGGSSEVIDIGTNFDKFRSFDFSFDFTVATFWVFSIWAIQDVFNKLGQEGMQRAFSTDSVRSARRSWIVCAIISLPGTLLFYALGTALFSFYHEHPEQLNPSLPNDSIFPLFIAQQMPIGIAGLVIAGLFAAAMSTLDSGMNSVTTVIVRDFFRSFYRDTVERTRLITAKVITVACGITATCIALYMASLGTSSLWDMFAELTGLIGGGFGGVIVLGMMTKRANPAGTWIGALVGTLVPITIRIMDYPISFFMFGTLAMGTCVIVGYTCSLILPGRTKDLSGLTIWTMDKPHSEEAAAVTAGQQN